MDILPLFSSNLLILNVDERVDQLSNGIDNIEFKSSGQSPGNLMSVDIRVLEKHSRIKNILLKKFSHYMKNVMKIENEFIITTSWYTKILPGAISGAHNHKNSYYSGILYFHEYDEESPSLQLMSPVIDFQDFFLQPKNTEDCHLQNSHSWEILPKKNLLVFFPSYLRHKVSNNFSNNTRYSLAFNIAPLQTYGSGDSTIDTNWYK